MNEAELSYERTLASFRSANRKVAEFILTNAELLDGGVIHQNPDFHSLSNAADALGNKLEPARKVVKLSQER